MIRQQPTLSKLSEPTFQDWVLFAVLTLVAGAAFSVIKVAVQVAEPAMVSAGRLWIAAIILLIYTYGTGHHLPGLLARTDGKPSLDKRWRFMLAGGVIGYTIPFTLYPLAQQTVDSILAGIYMAFMPLVTLVMAYFFAGESLTRRKAAGFLLGTVGVMFLIGPAALGTIGDNDAGAQSLLILSVTCYAIYAVLTRRAPEMPTRVFAAGTLLASAIAATPLAVLSGQVPGDIPVQGWLAILYLGVGPSGFAAIVIIGLIRKVGASFMATINYITPVIAIIFGMLIFSEPLKPTFLLGLIAILSGLALSQSKARQVSVPISEPASEAPSGPASLPAEKPPKD